MEGKQLLVRSRVGRKGLREFGVVLTRLRVVVSGLENVLYLFGMGLGHCLNQRDCIDWHKRS